MKKGRVTCKLAYLIYLGVVAALVIAALAYVRSLLYRYEDSQPQRRAWQAAQTLAADAAGGEFWSKYDLPQVTAGELEQGRDLLQEYLALYGQQLSVVQDTGSVQGDRLEYRVECGGFVLARVGLKAVGEPVTKLAVLTMREWAVDWVRPVLEARSYTLTVPSDFRVEVNGVPLTGEAADNGESTYAVSGLYLPPAFSIQAPGGEDVRYTLRDGRVLAEYFRYTLTLPAPLQVRVNGELQTGQQAGDGLLRYEILQLEKPEVTVSDSYGNQVSYEGGNKLPLTSCTITADERYTVQVDGGAAAEEDVTRIANPDYQHFTDYVQDLPQLCVYRIAVLREGAQVTVADELGNPVALEEGKSIYDFTSRVAGLEQVPEEVSGQVDVLRTAQDWSLFMTGDLAFSQIKSRLIAGSYQYEVAVKYASGVDITFTSKHTLANPAFTDSAVTNFAWITDDCFSVDIRFVKHMRLWYGALVDDPMNDRFYFVRYDDTADGVDNPTWKLASMKEVL